MLHHDVKWLSSSFCLVILLKLQAAPSSSHVPILVMILGPETYFLLSFMSTSILVYATHAGWNVFSI